MSAQSGDSQIRMVQQPSPLSKLTLSGRMLLLVHLLLGIGGSILYFCDFLPHFRTGSYPVFIFVAPVGLICFFSFLIIAWILERFGIQIYKK
jgi:hypothetical protein